MLRRQRQTSRELTEEEIRSAVAVYVAAPRLSSASSSPSAMRVCEGGLPKGGGFPDFDDGDSSLLASTLPHNNNNAQWAGRSVSMPRSRRLLRQHHALLQRGARWDANTEGNIASSSSSSSEFHSDRDDDDTTLRLRRLSPSARDDWVLIEGLGGMDGLGTAPPGGGRCLVHIEDDGPDEDVFKERLASSILKDLTADCLPNSPPKAAAAGCSDRAVVTALLGASGTGKSSLYFGAVRGATDTGSGMGVVDRVVWGLLHPPNTSPSACPSTDGRAKVTSKLSFGAKSNASYVGASTATRTPAQVAVDVLKEEIKEERHRLRTSWHSTGSGGGAPPSPLSPSNLRASLGVAASPPSSAAGPKVPDVLLSVVECRPMTLRVPVGLSPSAIVGAPPTWRMEERVVMVNVDLVSGKSDIEAVATALVEELARTTEGVLNTANSAAPPPPSVRGVFCQMSADAFTGPLNEGGGPAEGGLASSLLPVGGSPSISPHYVLCPTGQLFTEALTACLARSSSWSVPGIATNGRHPLPHSRVGSEVLEIPAATIAGGVETVLSSIQGHSSLRNREVGGTYPTNKLFTPLSKGDVVTPSASGEKSSLVVTIAIRSPRAKDIADEDTFTVWKIFDLAGPPVGHFHHTPSTSAATNTYNHIVRYYRNLHQSRGGGVGTHYNSLAPLYTSQYTLSLGGSGIDSTAATHSNRVSPSATPTKTGPRRRSSNVSFTGVNESIAISEGGWSMNTSMAPSAQPTDQSRGQRSYHCPVAATLIYLLSKSASSTTITIRTSHLCCLRQDGLFDHSNRLTLLVAATDAKMIQAAGASRSSKIKGSRLDGSQSVLGGHYAALVHQTLEFQSTATAQQDVGSGQPTVHFSVQEASSAMWGRMEVMMSTALRTLREGRGGSLVSSPQRFVVSEGAVRHWPQATLRALEKVGALRVSSSSGASGVLHFELTFPSRILVDLLTCSSGTPGPLMLGPNHLRHSSSLPSGHLQTRRREETGTTSHTSHSRTSSPLSQPESPTVRQRIPNIFASQQDTVPVYSLHSLLSSIPPQQSDDHSGPLVFVQSALNSFVLRETNRCLVLCPTTGHNSGDMSSSTGFQKRRVATLETNALENAQRRGSGRYVGGQVSRDLSPSQGSDIYPPSTVSCFNASAKSTDNRRASIDTPSPSLSKQLSQARRSAAESTEGGLTSVSTARQNNTASTTSTVTTTTTVNLLTRKVIPPVVLDATATTGEELAHFNDPTSMNMSNATSSHSYGTGRGEGTEDEPTAIEVEEDYDSDWEEEEADGPSQTELAIRAEQAALLKHLLEPSANGPLPGIDDGSDADVEENDDNIKERSSIQRQREAEGGGAVGGSDGRPPPLQSAEPADSSQVYYEVVEEGEADEGSEHDGVGEASDDLSYTSTDTTAPDTPSTSAKGAAKAPSEPNHQTRTMPPSAGGPHEPARPSWLEGLEAAMQSVRAGAKGIGATATPVTTNRYTTTSVSAKRRSPSGERRAVTTPPSRLDVSVSQSSAPSERLFRAETASSAPKRLAARIHNKPTAPSNTSHHTFRSAQGGSSYHADASELAHLTIDAKSHTPTSLVATDVLSNIAYVRSVLSEVSRLDEEGSTVSDSVDEQMETRPAAADPSGEVARLRRQLSIALEENERCMRFMEVDVAGPLIDYYERATSVDSMNDSTLVISRSESSSRRMDLAKNRSTAGPPNRQLRSLEETLEVIRSVGRKCLSQAEGSRMVLSQSAFHNESRHRWARESSARHNTSVLSSVPPADVEEEGLNDTRAARRGGGRGEQSSSLSWRDEENLHPEHSVYRNERSEPTTATDTFRKVLNSSGAMYQRASAKSNRATQQYADAAHEIRRLQRENDRLISMVGGQDALCRGLKDQLAAAHQRNAVLASRLQQDTSAGVIADLFTSACETSGRLDAGESVVTVSGPPPSSNLRQASGIDSEGGLAVARNLQLRIGELFVFVEDAFGAVVEQLNRRAKPNNRGDASGSPNVDQILRTVGGAKKQFISHVVPRVMAAVEEAQMELVSSATREQQYLNIVLQ